MLLTVVLERTLESPLDCKEIQPAHPKGNRSWVFTGRTDAEAETPICWPPDEKSWLIWKDPDAGKDWRREKGMTWDGWIASLTQWTWVWVNSRSWWWTGRPGMLQSMGSQRVGHDSDWTELTVWLWQAAICLILIPFRLPQISCFTRILKCFSSDSDNCPDVGIWPLHWNAPTCWGQVQSY